jgi:HSP20 family protein
MANNITRWNPLREMAAMQNALDRIFDDTWRGWQPVFGEGRNALNNLSLDVQENDGEYTVTTELPGVKAENIDVRLQNDMLTIEGEIPERTIEKEGTRWLMKERYYGRFSRTIRLPQPVKREKVDAHFENGVLTLTLPKAEEAQPKLIPVKTNGNKS